MCWELYNAIIEVLAPSTPPPRPRGDPTPRNPAGIKDKIRLKNRLWRRWQVTRDPALKAEVNRLQRSVTRQLNEWRNDRWSTTLESLNPEEQLLWNMTKRVMRIPTPSFPPGYPGELHSQRKPKPLPKALRLSFSRSPLSWSRPSSRRLTCSWSPTYRPLPANLC